MYPVYPEKMFQLVAAPAKIKVKTAMVVTAGLVNNSGNTSEKARGASTADVLLFFIVLLSLTDVVAAISARLVAANVLLFFIVLLSSPIKPIKSIAAMRGNLSMKRASPFSLVEESKKYLERGFAAHFYKRSIAK